MSKRKTKSDSVPMFALTASIIAAILAVIAAILAIANLIYLSHI